MLKMLPCLLLIMNTGTINELQFVVTMNTYIGPKIETPLTHSSLTFVDTATSTRHRFIPENFQRNLKTGSISNRYKNLAKNTTNNIEVLEFKSPTVLLGGEFRESFTKHLCETCTLSTCNTVKNIEYTQIGKKVCTTICQRQNELIRPIRPTEVEFIHSYCTKDGLKLATCICVFKVSTKEKVNFKFFHFTSNATGHLAMIQLEAGLPYK